jgi:hypothetical protein
MSRSATTKAAQSRHEHTLYCRRLVRHAAWARLPRWYRLQLLRSRGPKPLSDASGDAQHIRILPALKAMLLLIAALLFATPVAAQTPAPIPVPQTVVAPIAVVTNCTGNECLKGTGTLIAKGNGRGLVLTTGHVFGIGHGKLQAVLGGRPYAATLLGHDAQLDLAMLEIAEPPVEPLPIAEASPSIGARIQSFGFGPGPLSCNTGQVLGYVQEPRGPAAAMFEITGSAWQGDSGGPMLNERYELCGVIRGGASGLVNGVSFPFARRFIERFRARCGTRAPRAIPSYQVRSSTPPAGQAAPAAPPNAAQNIPENIPAANPPVDLGPAPWIAQRAELEQQHADAMRAKAAELAQLSQQLATERDNTERALAQLTAQKATCAGAPAAGPAAGAPSVSVPSFPTRSKAAPSAGESAGGGDGWFDLAGQAAQSVLIGLGVPSGLVAAGWWLARRLRSAKQARDLVQSQPAPAATPSAPAPTRATDSSPAQSNAPTVQHHNVFTYVPTDKYDKAWATAVARVGEKYPGMAQTLQMLVGVKDQLLNGESIDGVMK